MSVSCETDVFFFPSSPSRPILIPSECTCFKSQLLDTLFLFVSQIVICAEGGTSCDEVIFPHRKGKDKTGYLVDLGDSGVRSK